MGMLEILMNQQVYNNTMEENMEAYIFPVLAFVAGGYFLFRNISHFRDEGKLRHYVETSPKAKLWVKKFGIEKTVDLSRKIFIPLGILVSCVLIGIGVWAIYNVTRIYY